MLRLCIRIPSVSRENQLHHTQTLTGRTERLLLVGTHRFHALAERSRVHVVCLRLTHTANAACVGACRGACVRKVLEGSMHVGPTERRAGSSPCSDESCEEVVSVTLRTVCSYCHACLRSPVHVCGVCKRRAGCCYTATYRTRADKEDTVDDRVQTTSCYIAFDYSVLPCYPSYTATDESSLGAETW